MESQIVSGALIFVMVLLFLVVFDSTPMLQRIVLRLLRRPLPGEVQQERAITSALQPKAEETIEPIAAVPQTSGTSLDIPSSVELEGHQTESPGPLHRAIITIRKLINQKRQPHEVKASPLAKARKRVQMLAQLKKVFPRGKKRDTELESMLTDAIGTVRNSTDALADRVTQVETLVERVGQFEEGLASAGEDTQMVSEEMQDILGSIRVSIDGLEGRLNGMSTEIQEIKTREPDLVMEPVAESQNREIEIVDEETKNKVSRLEETVADINATLSSLPEKIQFVASEANDTNERLEILSGNMQSTMGFGIQKSFRCDSCGTSGVVASQVVCTKCGTGSWWGWWPEKEPDLEDDFESELGNELEFDDEIEDPKTTAEMTQSEIDQF